MCVSTYPHCSALLVCRPLHSVLRMKSTNASINITEVFDKQSSLLKDEEVYVPCLAASIDPSIANFLLESLSNEDILPLKRYGIDHLKRIRRHVNEATNAKVVQILLVPVEYREDVDRAFRSAESLSISMLKDIVEVLVPRYVPCCREEFHVWGKQWPINYRPNEEDREREKGLGPEECIRAATYVDMLRLEDLSVETLLGKSGCGGLIVNPEINQVVVTTTQSLLHLESRFGTLIKSHPVYSPTMTLIDGVSAMMRGDLDDPLDVLPTDPYLCTGFDIYLSREPDLMSSMALVHSRIRRVLYLEADKQCGALGSRLHLHQLRSLNHKFRVFRLGFDRNDIHSDESGIDREESS